MGAPPRMVAARTTPMNAPTNAPSAVPASAPLAPSPSPSPSPSPATPRTVTRATLLTALGTIALVVPEIWVAAIGLAWGLHVIMHLSATADVVLAAAVAVPALWATWWVARLAFEAETDPENAGA